MRGSDRLYLHGLLPLLSATFLAILPSPGFAADAEDALSEHVVTAQTRPNLFGTVALPGPAGRWNDKWHKIAADRSAGADLQQLIAPARGQSRLTQLHLLQAAIDRRIGWRSDGTQYGDRIYWATAAETLASGHGDDDDRAILKYQALRALGYPASDYYLMMGRDKVRGDYVLLAARAEGRWWLLEEQGDRAVPADQRRGFEPVASFGAGRSFIHGRRRAPQIAQAQDSSSSGSASGFRP